ncbi:neuroligin-2-like [Mercenaria mercenaria]|uniref:neuroligin-2-like n=1 Tax=Mercenaria mercenaria TaxID=6596 RepID=UPI00234F7B11|nr:neuroligin-2-like [Mercenaria mercenaria]
MGGGFTLGDSNMYLGDRLSVHGNVVLVTLNYRLSIFGFLSTGDSVSPGNYGLWDQQLAIKWVHDNIAAFGGDVGKVTIFGQSAGAGSVVYQGLHTGNKGLFQRIIAESGSVTPWWASTDKNLQYAKTVGSNANCKMDTSMTLLSCLRNVSADKLISLIAYSSGEDQLPAYPFLPTVDNDFIKFDPKRVFDLDNQLSRDAVKFFAEFDFLIGVNAGEGVSGLYEMFGVNDMMSFMPNRTDFKNRLIPMLVQVGYGEHVPSVLSKMIATENTNWTDPDNSLNVRAEYMRMHGDFSFNAGMYKTLDTHSTVTPTQKTYMYYFDIEPETRLWHGVPWYHKAMHGEELVFVFGYDISYKNQTLSPKEWEMNLSTDIMPLWANKNR